MRHVLLSQAEFSFGEYRAEIEFIDRRRGWWLTVARSSDGKSKVFSEDMCKLFIHLQTKYGTKYAVDVCVGDQRVQWKPMYKKGIW